MFDTVCFREPYPVVGFGSPLHERCTRRGGDPALIAQGSDGSALGVPGGLLYRDGVVAVRASSKGLFIMTSLARDPGSPGSPNVSVPRTRSDVERRVRGVEGHLRELGLVVDLDEAGLSRVDVCKDVVVDAPYGDYLPGLQARGFQRMSPADLNRSRPFDGKAGSRSGARVKAKVSHHTYGKTTSSRASVFYCKTAHLVGKAATREYGEGVVRSLGGSDVMRGEDRYLNARAVSDGLGVRKGSDLAGEWDAVGSRYCNNVLAHLGSGPGAPSQTGRCPDGGPIGGLSSRIDAIIELYGRGKLSVLLDLAVDGLAARARNGESADIEHARALYAEAGVRKRDLDAAFEALLPLVRAEGARTAGACLDELRGSLLGPPLLWPPAGG